MGRGVVMIIPIICGGKRIGTLETRREGPYTRFDARCAFVPGIRRLCVFGGGRSSVLGVMQPEGGALVLRRALSRDALRSFPGTIEYAAFEKERRPASLPEKKDRIEEKEATGEGMILSEDGVRYLALPCALRRAVPGTRVREIGGRRWLLFRC